jgi:hypothetical protein
VNLPVVNYPEVTAAWADKYFWQNERLVDVPELCAIEYGIEPRPALSDIPEHWVVVRLAGCGKTSISYQRKVE